MSPVRRSLVLASALAAVALAGCETTTRFAPATAPGGLGYAETQVEANRWRVTFRGGSDADGARVYNLALLRAADLTLAQGFDWFQVADRTREAGAAPGPRFSVGVGGFGFGRGGGGGGGVSTDLGGERTEQGVTLEIIMGRGPPPTVNAYDARNLRATMAGAPA